MEIDNKFSFFNNFSEGSVNTPVSKNEDFMVQTLQG